MRERFGGIEPATEEKERQKLQWLREEVFRPDDPETMYESLPIGRVDVDDGQTACHCLVEKLAVYENYSAPMLRRNWPHVAAVLLDP